MHPAAVLLLWALTQWPATCHHTSTSLKTATYLPAGAALWSDDEDSASSCWDGQLISERQRPARPVPATVPALNLTPISSITATSRPLVAGTMGQQPRPAPAMQQLQPLQQQQQQQQQAPGAPSLNAAASRQPSGAGPVSQLQVALRQIQAVAGPSQSQPPVGSRPKQLTIAAGPPPAAMPLSPGGSLTGASLTEGMMDSIRMLARVHADTLARIESIRCRSIGSATSLASLQGNAAADEAEQGGRELTSSSMLLAVGAEVQLPDGTEQDTAPDFTFSPKSIAGGGGASRQFTVPFAGAALPGQGQQPPGGRMLEGAASRPDHARTPPGLPMPVTGQDQQDQQQLRPLSAAAGPQSDAAPRLTRTRPHTAAGGYGAITRRDLEVLEEQIRQRIAAHTHANSSTPVQHQGSPYNGPSPQAVGQQRMNNDVLNLVSACKKRNVPTAAFGTVGPPAAPPLKGGGNAPRPGDGWDAPPTVARDSMSEIEQQIQKRIRQQQDRPVTALISQ